MFDHLEVEAHDIPVDLVISADALRLIQPSAEYAGQIAEYRRAFLQSGDSMDGTGGILRDCEDPLEWVRKSEEYQDAAKVPDGWVPATQFICVRVSDNKIVGMLQLRHHLNDHLAQFGGNIGYSVHPQERRKGYSKWMLGSALPYCRELGLERVLLTCNAESEASRRTILANGGVFDGSARDSDGELVERYWISL